MTTTIRTSAIMDKKFEEHVKNAEKKEQLRISLEAYLMVAQWKKSCNCNEVSNT